ncbi:MAG TPA: hypothetical protein VLL76_00145 [Candidatus Omnitrophota bacterium]|nr:hypothetical protein [Candidatus Omnitrophota bacterium]
MANDGAFEMLFDRIPAEVAGTFTDQQRAALYSAVKPTTWKRHPINIRLSFPFVGGRYFITVVGGQEKRSTERLAREHRMFPFRTIGNVMFLMGVGGAFYLAALFGMVIFSGLIEF